MSRPEDDDLHHAGEPQPAPSSKSSFRSLLTRPISFGSIGKDTEAPMVRILYPTDYEVLQGGAQVAIRWESKDNVAVTAQKVLFSADDGRTYQEVSPELPGSARSLLWEVPRLLTQVGRVKVVAMDYAGNRGFASSRQPFTIEYLPTEVPQVVLTAPQGRQVLRAGIHVPITWRTLHVSGAVRFDLDFSFDGGATYKKLVHGLAGTIQSVRWTVPNQPTRHGRLRLAMRTADGQRYEHGSTDDLIIVGQTSEIRAVK